MAFGDDKYEIGEMRARFGSVTDEVDTELS